MRVVAVHERLDPGTQFLQVGVGVAVKKFVFENAPKLFCVRVAVGASGSGYGSLHSHSVALVHNIFGIKLRAPVRMENNSIGSLRPSGRGHFQLAGHKFISHVIRNGVAQHATRMLIAYRAQIRDTCSAMQIRNIAGPHRVKSTLVTHAIHQIQWEHSFVFGDRSFHHESAWINPSDTWLINFLGNCFTGDQNAFIAQVRCDPWHNIGCIRVGMVSQNPRLELRPTHTGTTGFTLRSGYPPAVKPALDTLNKRAIRVISKFAHSDSIKTNRSALVDSRRSTPQLFLRKEDHFPSR